MKRQVPMYVFGALALLGCSSANDRSSDSTEGTVTSIPGVGNPGKGVVISAEQANSLVGKSEVDAEAYARENGWVWRIGRRDGEEFAITMDYCECRVTVSIDNAVVTEAVVG